MTARDRDAEGRERVAGETHDDDATPAVTASTLDTSLDGASVPTSEGTSDAGDRASARTLLPPPAEPSADDLEPGSGVERADALDACEISEPSGTPSMSPSERPSRLSIPERETYFELHEPLAAAPLIGCFAAIGTAICAADALAAGSSLGELALATTFGTLLGTFVGAFVAAWTVPFALRWPRLAPWLSAFVGGLLGVFFAGAPGMFEPLVGPHGRLVWAAVVVGPLGGAVCGFVLSRAVRSRSMISSTVLLGAALAFAFVEPRFVALSPYPTAEWLIRLAPWAAAALALHELRRKRSRPLRPKLRWALFAVWAAMALVPLTRATAAPGELDGVLALRHPQLAIRLLRAATDLDGRGSAYFGGRRREVLVPPPAPRPCAPPPLVSAPENAPSVLLVTIDTLRVDHVGAYGYDRPTTARLDALAERGRLFERGYSAGGWTNVALPALHRGAPARSLRWRRLFATNEGLLEPEEIPSLGPERRVKFATLVLDDSGTAGCNPPSLAAQLAAAGYQTAAVIDTGGNAFLLPGFGLDVGFESYDTEPFDDDAEVARRAVAMIQRFEPGRPFFLWAHFYGPHAPDDRHADAPDFGDGAIDRYDHEIAHTDVQLGRLFEATSEDVLTIVTADHGELFGPLTRAHGNDLRPATVRVPFIVAGPGVTPGREGAAVGHVDIVPTVLAAVGAAEMGTGVGADLRGALPGGRVVLTDTWRFDARGRPTLDHAAAADATQIVARDLILQIDRAYGANDFARVPAAPAPRPALHQALEAYLAAAHPFPRTRR